MGDEPAPLQLASGMRPEWPGMGHCHIVYNLPSPPLHSTQPTIIPHRCQQPNTHLVCVYHTLWWWGSLPVTRLLRPAQLSQVAIRPQLHSYTLRPYWSQTAHCHFMGQQ
jgi:hypothetical protein